MKFILDNIVLVVIALVSGGLLLWPLVRKSGGTSALGPLEATQLINHRNAIVVDLRDEKDFALGSLAGARNIPFAQLDARASELVRFKARPVLLVCGAGQQSAKAIAAFKAQGFDEVHALAGGVAGWKQGGLPLVQPGRDNTRVASRDATRKSRGDNRPGDRNKGARTPRAPALPVAPAAAASDAIAAPVEPVVAGVSLSKVDAGASSASDADASTRVDTDGSTLPNRVKELS